MKKKLKKIVFMSRKISLMDHLAFVTGARDLLVVELLCCVVLYMLIKLASCKLSSGTEHELR